jgi:hypothetical protein
VAPRDLIEIERSAAENAALGMDTPLPYSPYPAAITKEHAIPVELELLERQFEQLASQEYRNSDYIRSSDFEVVPYELKQIESEPGISTLFDTKLAAESDSPVMPEELIMLEQQFY